MKSIYNLALVFIQILILTGCVKRHPVSLYYLDQSKLTDIPFPMGIGPIYNLNSSQGQNISQNISNSSKAFGKNLLSLKFDSKLSMDKLENFYKEHMDLDGWQLAWHAMSNQTCMIFQKPNKVCVIVIEQDLDNLDPKSNKINNKVKIISGLRNN